MANCPCSVGSDGPSGCVRGFVSTGAGNDSSRLIREVQVIVLSCGKKAV